MEHFVKLIPEEIQTEINFAEMDSHQLHSAVPKQFRLKKELEQFQMNDYFMSNQFFVFSFVRHPFDRLVSAYLDKIDNMGDPGYRSIAKNIKTTFGKINFKNFLLFVMKKIENYEDCSAKNLQCNLIDVHWRPYYLRCAYCDINYNFIGRMESFERDVR